MNHAPRPDKHELGMSRALPFRSPSLGRHQVPRWLGGYHGYPTQALPYEGLPRKANLYWKMSLIEADRFAQLQPFRNVDSPKIAVPKSIWTASRGDPLCYSQLCSVTQFMLGRGDPERLAILSRSHGCASLCIGCTIPQPCCTVTYACWHMQANMPDITSRYKCSTICDASGKATNRSSCAKLVCSRGLDDFV